MARHLDALLAAFWPKLWRLCVLVYAVTLFVTGETARAHDAFEITSTARVFTDEIVLQVEMEFCTALRLAEIPVPPPPFTATELYSTARPKLLAAAGDFFQIEAGGNRLRALATNVTLGVEDHVQFHVRFSGSRFRPLRFVAAGLRPLEAQGPYGTTLTVLDWINQRVLGQSVLYPTSTLAEFSSPTNGVQPGSPTALVPLAQATTRDASANDTVGPVSSEKHAPSMHSFRRNLILGGVALAALLAGLRKWND